MRSASTRFPKGLGQPCERLLGRLVVVDPDQFPDRFGERPVRDALAVREATATRNECAVVEIAKELLHKPRLAYAGKAKHREKLAGAVADCLLEGVTHSATFALPSHHWRGKTAGLPFGSVDERDHVPRVLRGLRDNRAPDQLVGFLVDNELAGRSNAGGSSERLAGCTTVCRRIGARDDFTRADSDSEIEPDGALGYQLVGEPGECLPSLDRRPHRTQRIVLVHGRQSEDNRERFPGCGFEGAAMPLGGALNRIESAVGHAAETLGIEALTELGRESDPDEEGCNGLASITGADRVLNVRNGVGQNPLLDTPVSGHFTIKRRILVENLLVELAQTAARLDTQLLDQHRACSLVGVQRVGLAPGLILRKH